MKIIDVKSIFIVFIVFVSLVFNVNSEELSDANNYSVNIGVALKSLDLDVYDAGSINPNGTLTEGEYFTYSLSLNSPYKFFSENSRFGYYIEYAYSKFEMNSQLINNQSTEVDLGTGVDGNYFSVTPVVFYNYFDSIRARKKDALIVGLGIGIGYLDAIGDIQFTETDNQIHDVDVNDFDISISIFLEYQHNDWFLRISSSGPDVTSGNFDYTISDFSMVFGYSFVL